MKDRIVTEVTVNGTDVNKGQTIGQLFNDAIVTTQKKGYDLESWQYQRTASSETVLAVFAKVKR